MENVEEENMLEIQKIKLKKYTKNIKNITKFMIKVYVKE